MNNLPTWVTKPDSIAIIYLKRTRLFKESVLLDTKGLEHSIEHNSADPIFKSLLCKLETKDKIYVIVDHDDDATKRLALFKNTKAQEELELRRTRFQHDSGGVQLDLDAFRLISYPYFKHSSSNTVLPPSQVFNGNFQLIQQLEQLTVNQQSFQVVPTSVPESKPCIVCSRGGSGDCALDAAFYLLHELVETCKYCGLSDSNFVQVFENSPWWWTKNGANGSTRHGSSPTARNN